MNAAATYPRGLAISFGAHAHREGCEHCECSTPLGDFEGDATSPAIESLHFCERRRHLPLFRSTHSKDSV